MRLQQVLGNLLSNAIKFNRPGGRVMVDAASWCGVRLSWICSTAVPMCSTRRWGRTALRMGWPLS